VRSQDQELPRLAELDGVRQERRRRAGRGVDEGEIRLQPMRLEEAELVGDARRGGEQAFRGQSERDRAQVLGRNRSGEGKSRDRRQCRHSKWAATTRLRMPAD
jgi:hypothetical protein